MAQIKTPAEIANEVYWSLEIPDDPNGDDLRQIMREAIEADRAQRHNWDAEIYIVQNDAGEVLDVFRDSDEAAAAYGHRYDAGTASTIAEIVWEPGEYAEQRIAELSREWEEAVNYGEHGTPTFASDYALSGDDWRAGLDDEEAAEIVRLIEWQEAQK